jgi:hypothetical protein
VVSMVNVNLPWMTGRRAQGGCYARARIWRVAGPRIGIRWDGWGTRRRARRRADNTGGLLY